MYMWVIGSYQTVQSPQRVDQKASIPLQQKKIHYLQKYRVSFHVNV